MKEMMEKDNRNGELDEKTVITQQEIAVYQGQFPHPDILKGFAEIVPTMPERILKMTEDYTKSDIKRENRDSLSLILGQILTFLITIIGFVFSAILAKLGMAEVSIASIVGGLVPVLIAGINSFRHKDNESKKK